MGRSSGHGLPPKTAFRPQRLPIDASELALKGDACHCVADAELENRYNLLRAEEHARTDGKCGPEWSTEVARRPENAARNRYHTVVPWDHSRVILPVEHGENDYINASWVQLGSRSYIATQGPLASTVHDFWQMVYAYGGHPAVIIMLTPLHEHSVEKCAKYWPDSKHHPIHMPRERGFRFGLTISLHVSRREEQYHYSSFVVTPTDKSMPPRTVHHVYYHSWLDYSKPNADADLRSLIHLVNNQLRNAASPPIVHCSAGIGRTGTFIALDALLTRIDTDILPVVVPRICPVWKGSQHIIQYRQNVFTGHEDMHVESDSGSPLLSKFNMAEASAAPSIMSRPHTTKTRHRQRDSNGHEIHGLEEAPHLPNTLSDASSTLSTGVEGGKTTDTSLITTKDDLANGLRQLTHDDDDYTEIKADTPPEESSALSGPKIRKIAPIITSVAPEVFSEIPDKVDVMDWYQHSDPVMSAIRTMRKQRPKMVQGKQQLGYVYDQFEVGQQLARATHLPNQVLRRRSTAVTVPTVPVESPRKQSHKILSMIGLRRSSASSTMSDHEPMHTTHRRKGIFSGSILK